MKKTLLTLCLAITMSFSFSQQTINLTPSDVIQNVLDTLTMQDAVIISLAPGTYNESISLFNIPTTIANTLTIQSADINNMAIITDAANNVINVGIGNAKLKSLKVVSNLGVSISITDYSSMSVNNFRIEILIY